MKQFEKRLRALEAALVEPPKPWRQVTIDIGETGEEVFEREGIGPDDNVISIIIYPGRPLVPLDECTPSKTRAELFEKVRKRNARNGATEEKLETAGEASPAVRQRVSRPHKRSWMAK